MKLLSTPPKAAPPALADAAFGVLAPVLRAQLAVFVFQVGLGIAAVALVARVLLLPGSGTTSRTLSLCPARTDRECPADAGSTRAVAYKRATPKPDGTTELVLSPTALLERLA